LIERDFISGEWMVPEGIDEEKTANLKLDQLDYVIFDTETTGLRPQAGDEIISIAAVRMTGGEIDEENIFSRLVDPGRKIPRRSTRVHGITDAMVAGAPDIASVLREFREFIADDVLVAHHAAFDMSFLRMKEAVIGEALGNIVLDTLLLSMFLDRFSHDHSLEGLAERAGVTIHGRHSALGDAMATARVFRKLLSRLQTQGVVTLRHALDGSREIADLQKNRSL
jgi:DNA polymerase-3 subunit epsilon